MLAARQLLASHHGVRGSEIRKMPPKSKPDADGFSKVIGPKHHDFDWTCFLQAKRVMNSRGALSSASLMLSRALRSLGINYEGAGPGGIGTRVNIGAPCRLWYQWFVAIRDQEGLGWFFSKCDTRLSEERVQILLSLFARDRSARQLAMPFTQVLSELVDDVAAITQ